MRPSFKRKYLSAYFKPYEFLNAHITIKRFSDQVIVNSAADNFLISDVIVEQFLNLIDTCITIYDQTQNQIINVIINGLILILHFSFPGKAKHPK